MGTFKANSSLWLIVLWLVLTAVGGYVCGHFIRPISLAFMTAAVWGVLTSPILSAALLRR